MKRLFVFVPAIILVLFLLYSFVLKAKDAADATTIGSGPLNTVFKSSDGGQTWQEVSHGLPENLKKGDLRGNSFFANDKGLFLRFGNELYHNTSNAAVPFWTKEISAGEYASVAPANNKTIYWGANLKKTNGTNVWSPIFKTVHRPGVRTAFETAGGVVFIGTERGFFKTTNNGHNWKQVHAGSLVGHLAESDGILVAISGGRIIRSTDNGGHWSPVISEDNVAFDVKSIKGDFVAITASSKSGERRLSTSYDGGKSWQIINASPQNKIFSASIMKTWNDRQYLQRFPTSIIQVGTAFFSAHPHGIFKSSDNGRTWKLLLPSLTDKGFNLLVSGSVIYAVRSMGGC